MEATTNPITGALNSLNSELEENRLQHERLKKMSEQISQEIHDNKEQRIKIEAELDKVYDQIKQQKS